MNILSIRISVYHKLLMITNILSRNNQHDFIAKIGIILYGWWQITKCFYILVYKAQECIHAVFYIDLCVTFSICQADSKNLT